MSRHTRIPKYQLHKASGQAKVRLHNRDHYLGVYGTPESRQRYDELIAAWLAKRHSDRPTAPAVALTVADICHAYMTYAEGYYRKGGKVTGHVAVIKSAFWPLRERHGDLPARGFGPKALKEVRAEMIERGWTRSYVNKCVGCIVRAWAWAVTEELVPGEAAHALREVPNLREGEAGVREGRRVGPVSRPVVEKTLAELKPVLRDLLTVLYLAGMRPVEVCHLRGQHIDTTGQVPGGPRFPGLWVFSVPPEGNKNYHRRKDRIVFLGPEAQRVLTPYLERKTPDEYLFCPADGPRKTRKRDRKRPPGEKYNATVLRQAILRACKRAGVAAWHSNQLRHARATDIDTSSHLGDAQSVLGHSSPDTTKRYAATSQEWKALSAAADTMRRVG